jgi:tRNA(fMet)-specific endonuclease VapC
MSATRYMLDTNVCIYLIRRRPLQVIERFARLGYGDVVISSITLAELCFGARVSPHRAQEEQALAGLLEDLPALPFEESAAATYALVRSAVPDRRRDALDRLIAAHAIAADCVLVTNNEADFRDIPGLQLENWVAAAGA